MAGHRFVGGDAGRRRRFFRRTPPRRFDGAGRTGHDPLELRVTTVGKALPNTEIQIVDPATGAPLPLGQQGELCARGYMVMKGYDDDPAVGCAWLAAGRGCCTGGRGKRGEDVLDCLVRLGGGETKHPVDGLFGGGLPERREGEKHGGREANDFRAHGIHCR